MRLSRGGSDHVLPDQRVAARATRARRKQEKIKHAECYVVKRTCDHVERVTSFSSSSSRETSAETSLVYTKLCLLMRIAKTTRRTCYMGKSPRFDRLAQEMYSLFRN